VGGSRRAAKAARIASKGSLGGSGEDFKVTNKSSGGGD